MITNREHVMIGLFDNAGDARRAIEDLRDASFSDRKIGVLTHDKAGDPEVKSFRSLERDHAATGVAVGIAAGAGAGTIWALVIAAAILPAVGPILAGGMLVAIAATAASGAAAGGLVGALVGLGFTDADAAYYDAEFRKGRTILVVHPGLRGRLAKIILNANHAADRASFTATTFAEQLEHRHA